MSSHARPVAVLGELVEILSGFAFKSEKFGDAGDLPLIRIRDVKRGWSDTYYSGDFEAKYIVNDGDLLVGMDGEFNRECWRGGRALLNQRVCKITSNPKKLNGAYLYYFLSQALKKIEDKTPFATVKHLSIKDIRNIEIPLPPLDEQRRIAAILDKADALRRKRKRIIELVRSIPQTLFLEMFGDPQANPGRWNRTSPLSDVADIGSGITKGRKEPSTALRTVPYLAVANVQDRALDLTSVKTIEASEEEIDRLRLNYGDLVLTEGGDPDKLGRGTVWRDELPEAIHQNHIFRVRVNTNELDPLYLNFLVGSEYGKKYFFRSAKQTTGIASINKSQLSRFPVLLPPLEMQRRFAFEVERMAALQRYADRAGEAMLELFASLQHRAFFGQL